MSEYTPRVGDTVRATLGESVLVGRVAEVGVESRPCYVTLFVPDLSTEHFWFSLDSDWKFEQVVTIPTRVGAIIRRADGDLFVRDADSNSLHWLKLSGAGGVASDNTALAGGFTVLFDGVDK